MTTTPLRRLAAIAALTACGGGAGTPAPAPPSEPPPPSGAKQPRDAADAARFLHQATFGPTRAEIDAVMAQGFDAWFQQQAEKPMTQHQSRVPSYADPFTPLFVGRYPLQTSFWQAAATSPDAWRQRVAYAYSQIFVISINDNAVLRFPRGVAAYQDMLAKNAFGNYRTLLEDVAMHPMMGIYLSHLGNRKEDPATGRIPDENFAREVMQLFSIGLVALNEDGTPKRDANGRPIETYGNADVIGMARVFTGWSFAAPQPDDDYFENALFPPKADPDRDIRPMRAYPQHHSSGEKRFLGAVVPAGATPEQSRKAALDALANHPNVGPFLGKQLIQRFVTSNPSPAYVARISRVFANNGAGVRGDLRAVLQAILTDDEARRAPSDAEPERGKLREPLLRITAWMRAFDAKTRGGAWAWYFAGDTMDNIGQEPFGPPSVFGWFRPGYVPPGSRIAAAANVAPEMQITGETTVAAYANVVQAIASGIPRNLATLDVYSDYSAEIALADRPDALIEHLNLLLGCGSFSAETKALMREAIESIPSGSFDFLNSGHPPLLKQVADALDNFDATLGELGLRDRVVAFTASDFGRALVSNGDGSDHGWGSHHLVMGGAVRGGDFHGTMPIATTGTDTDAGQGRLVPTTSVDQYAATLARWFGVPAGQLADVVPNLGNFASADVGFLA